jgi:hypothetical protein
VDGRGIFKNGLQEELCFIESRVLWLDKNRSGSEIGRNGYKVEVVG